MSFQLVLSTDGKTSFASFIYEELEEAKFFNKNLAKIGFDAGDENRGVKLSEDNHSLRGSNTFRIDGNYSLFYSKAYNHHCVSVYAGNCITNTSFADVCGLNSTSLECRGGFTASSCICQQEALNNSKCQLRGEFTKEGSYS